MTFSKTSFFVAISVVAVLSGCAKLRFWESDSADTNNSVNVRPSSTIKRSSDEAMVYYPVQQSSVPEMVSDFSASEEEDSSGYEQMGNLPLPSNAIELLPASIAGVWNLSMNGRQCRIATPQTKFGRGYRAGPLNCSGIISRIKSWNVKGKKLYFYDDTGRVVVTLFSFQVDRFEGYTFDNKPVILSR
ncbi:AprI/Inh family metalloprotease inhibitor [Bartonella sp. A05]|uniref:AprI/Inh family metalloprotease inhibitor n=1 Tax=Bartonella sp. A05 TaxID=2967261 RepID=UPI0022A9A643|nr:AprI/Inh family metalloprotease inhibitor [Bartonella sp. A05]MCZ2203527.1 protease inhibitor Inh/omp19 family protein [Bartonella sp. A05]